jgi:hypothetical protein
LQEDIYVKCWELCGLRRYYEMRSSIHMLLLVENMANVWRIHVPIWGTELAKPAFDVRNPSVVDLGDPGQRADIFRVPVRDFNQFSNAFRILSGCNKQEFNALSKRFVPLGQPFDSLVDSAVFSVPEILSLGCLGKLKPRVNSVGTGRGSAAIS